MKVIIAGGRHIRDRLAITSTLHLSGLDITEVVSGCASGVDREGEFIAKEIGVPVKRFPAEWNKHGKRAGPIRNRQMAEYADALVLVWDGKSRGSASMKREAERAGIPVFEAIIRSD